MSIVDKIYQENIGITEEEVLAKIIDEKELSALDFWLLPQYVFDEWRKKHDYPRILDNFKRRLPRFKEWMETFELTDEILMDGYVSEFLKFKYTEIKKDHIFHLVKVTYKGKTKHQVWYSYDKNSLHNENEVTYEYVRSFQSYFEWCELNKIDGYEIRVDKYYQAYENEEVYYNFDLRLIKMGRIEPPVNALNQILRQKKIEFANVSGLKLNDEIINNRSIEFIFCVCDNISCKHLKTHFFTFENSSVRNLNITNSEISNWKFINSIANGRIKDSLIKNSRIWGGNFTPIFENSEPENIGVWYKNLKHSPNFDRTYRNLYKAHTEIGNYKEANKLKISELDFKRKQVKGFWNKTSWFIDKYFWGYGREPKKIITFTFAIILLFGLIFSLISNQLIPNETFLTLNWAEKILYSLYSSVVTFVTLGFSDVYPNTGFAKLLVSIEAIIGALSLGALIVTLTKTKE
ncbi:potassium channel family protein [Aequorivita xiaoshiensis]|uniref:Potassium channel family protein n=1 Tax=Aequorivita xiaoshiensis TaxID=2874476 RepID=A0A9X1R4M6_9FLAO|nr:potassium channel family protein [Aequorivita xiaoshiensis]MCG2432161.1 potassium channel family protein [Aequorivita xiaoshiensis]